MGLSLATLYIAPEMISLNMASLKGPAITGQAVDMAKLSGLAVPVPAKRPSGLPEINQPHQNDVSTLLARWEDTGFSLEAIRHGKHVPRDFIDQIPVDILDIETVAERKRIFLSVILPHILAINEEIKLERARLMQLTNRHQDGKALDADDRRWLNGLANKYKVADSSLEELAKRVNIVPPSLALAQGVEESGWGTSRFAREGNALYGQRIWKTGAGIVPKGREDGKMFEVRVYHHIGASIQSYIHNLNTHAAYGELRNLRQQEQQAGGRISGYNLAETLTSYSERGGEYVETIQNLIQSNRFDEFDSAKLDPERFAKLPEPDRS